MAVFKSALLTEASGSIGGIVLSHNRGGLYMRARTIPVNPGTLPQREVQNAMGKLVADWNDALSIAQRDAWDVYASNVPLTGPLGDPITVSGINHFVRSNVPRIAKALSQINDAPTIFNTGVLSAMVFTAAVEATQTVTFALSTADLWNVANGFLLIYVSRPVNLTINFFKGPYQFSIAGPGSGPVPSPFDATAPFAFVAGQRLYARARASFPDGRLTATQFLGPVTATA